MRTTVRSAAVEAALAVVLAAGTQAKSDGETSSAPDASATPTSALTASSPGVTAEFTDLAGGH